MNAMKQDNLVERVERADRFAREHGFTCQQINGQRISINRKINPLPRDVKENEVFVGKVPRNVFEDELIPFMLQAGPIYKCRIMMDFGGTNRGYAFVRYVNASDARRAADLLDNRPIRLGEQPSGVCPSFDNKRLFFGNLPRLSERELYEKLSQILEGIQDVKLHTSKSQGNVYQQRERCFAYVTFKEHTYATKARRLLVPGTVRICGEKITVDWAKTEETVSSARSSHSSSSTGSGSNSPPRVWARSDCSLTSSMESPPVAMLNNVNHINAINNINHNNNNNTMISQTDGMDTNALLNMNDINRAGVLGPKAKELLNFVPKQSQIDLESFRSILQEMLDSITKPQ